MRREMPRLGPRTTTIELDKVDQFALRTSTATQGARRSVSKRIPWVWREHSRCAAVHVLALHSARSKEQRKKAAVMSEAVGVLVDLLIDTIQARLWLDHELRGLVKSAYEIEEEFKEKYWTMRNAPMCASGSAGKSTNQEARLQRIAEVLEDVAGAASEEVVRKMETAGLMRVLRESNAEQATLAPGELDSVNPGQDSADVLEQFNRRLPESVGTMLDLSLEEEYNETGERLEEDLSDSTGAEAWERGAGGGTSVWDDRVGHFLETLRSLQYLEDLEKVQLDVESVASSLAVQNGESSTLETCKEELLELSIQDFLLCMKEQNIDALAFINVVYRHMSSL